MGKCEIPQHHYPCPLALLALLLTLCLVVVLLGVVIVLLAEAALGISWGDLANQNVLEAVGAATLSGLAGAGIAASLAILPGLMMGRSRAGFALWLLVLLIPLLIPPATLGAGARVALEWLGSITPLDSAKLRQGWTGLIVAKALVSLPLALLLFAVMGRVVSPWQGLIAQTLGVPPSTVRRRVLWPQLRPLGVSAMVILVIRAMLDAGTVVSLISEFSGPAASAAVYSSAASLHELDYPLVAAMMFYHIFLGICGALAAVSFLKRCVRC